VSFHVLLNLAEDLSIEVKMIKKDIVKYLITMLDRDTPELLVLVITFLRKLSVFKENKDEMLRHSEMLLRQLERLVESSHKTLQSLTLRFILNLTHDATFRQQIAKHPIFEKLVLMFKNQNYTVVTLQIMYQISIDDKNRLASAFSECVPQLLRMILEYKGDRVNSEVIAVAINIAMVPKHRQQIVEDYGIKFLMRRALKTHDPLLFKMLRAISQHPDTAVKMKFLVLC
jgi:Kinesin-associated protein (KAP)